MAKARLSQMASTWVHEENENKSKHKEIKNTSRNKKRIKISKSKRIQLPSVPYKVVQTVRLKPETLKRLWMNRALTGKTLSATIDELVTKHIRA